MVQIPDHKSTGVFRIRRDQPEDRKESLGTRTGCGQESYSSYCYHGPNILVIVLRWSRSGVLISDTYRVLSLRAVEIIRHSDSLLFIDAGSVWRLDMIGYDETEWAAVTRKLVMVSDHLMAHAIIRIPFQS